MAQLLENKTIGAAVELLKKNDFDGLTEAVTVLLRSLVGANRAIRHGNSSRKAVPAL